MQPALLIYNLDVLSEKRMKALMIYDDLKRSVAMEVVSSLLDCLHDSPFKWKQLKYKERNLTEKYQWVFSLN